MLYFLMHKDDAVCLLDMSPDGIIENRSHYYVKELLPLPATGCSFFTGLDNVKSNFKSSSWHKQNACQIEITKH